MSHDETNGTMSREDLEIFAALLEGLTYDVYGNVVGIALACDESDDEIEAKPCRRGWHSCQEAAS